MSSWGKILHIVRTACLVALYLHVHLILYYTVVKSHDFPCCQWWKSYCQIMYILMSYIHLKFCGFLKKPKGFVVWISRFLFMCIACVHFRVCLNVKSTKYPAPKHQCIHSMFHHWNTCITAGVLYQNYLMKRVLLLFYISY